MFTGYCYGVVSHKATHALWPFSVLLCICSTCWRYLKRNGTSDMCSQVHCHCKGMTKEGFLNKPFYLIVLVDIFSCWKIIQIIITSRMNDKESTVHVSVGFEHLPSCYNSMSFPLSTLVTWLLHTCYFPM
jgi:hypothetical protein